MKFLDGVKDIIPVRKLRHRKFDLFVYVDAASPSRLPPEVRPFAEKLPTIVIDHHATSQAAGAAAMGQFRFGDGVKVSVSCATVLKGGELMSEDVF